MNEDKSFLPHFLDEEIYVIDKVVSDQEPQVKQEVEAKSTEQVDKEEAVKQVVEEPKEVYEVPSVEESSQKVEETTQPVVELTYEGQNDKGVLLIVNNISSEEKAFLEKVLGAVKLTMNDCALLQLSQNSSPEHLALVEKFECEIILNLGSQQLEFLKGINNYKINFVADKKALQTDDLKSIMTDVAKKKQLWECLQQLFL